MTPSQAERLLAAQKLTRYNEQMKVAQESAGSFTKEAARQLAQTGKTVDDDVAFWRDAAFEVLKARIQRPEFLPDIDQFDRTALPDWLSPKVAASLIELKEYRGNLPDGVILAVANLWQAIKMLARQVKSSSA